MGSYSTDGVSDNQKSPPDLLGKKRRRLGLPDLISDRAMHIAGFVTKFVYFKTTDVSRHCECYFNF